MSDQLTTLKDWSLIWLDDGNRYITKQYDCAHAVKRITETVAKILRSKETLFNLEIKGRHTHRRITKLGRAFFLCTKADLDEIARQYPDHRFSPMFTIFKRYCKGLWVGDLEPHSEMFGRLNEAVRKMRELGSGIALPKRLNNLKRCERENSRSARKLLASMRAAYSKLLVVRLDLEYYSEYGPGKGFHAQAITVEQAQAHRDLFLSYLRRGPFSDHLAGYLWKMEAGFEKGCHFHLAIFFDGQKVSKDITIGNMLGEHWKAKITAGAGMFFNCNMKKESYRDCGIGMVNRGDDEMWGALGKAIRYMTKIDHYLRFEAPNNSRTFGTGGPYKK